MYTTLWIQALSHRPIGDKNKESAHSFSCSNKFGLYTGSWKKSRGAATTNKRQQHTSINYRQPPASNTRRQHSPYIPTRAKLKTDSSRQRLDPKGTSAKTNNKSHDMSRGAPQTINTANPQDPAAHWHSARRLKLKPQTHDGNSSTCEEWKCSFAAYMGLMDTAYPRLLLQAETSDERLRDTDLRNAGAKRMKQTDGYNFQSTSSTFSPTPPQEQQPQHADNTNQIWASKSIDSKVTGSQFHWEHVASATSHGFSSPYSTTAALKSHSPTGSLNSHATSVATTRTYQTQSRSQS